MKKSELYRKLIAPLSPEEFKSQQELYDDLFDESKDLTKAEVDKLLDGLDPHSEEYKRVWFLSIRPLQRKLFREVLQSFLDNAAED